MNHVSAIRTHDVMTRDAARKVPDIAQLPPGVSGALAAFIRNTQDQIHLVDGGGRIVWSNASALRRAHGEYGAAAGRDREPQWCADHRLKILSAIRTARYAGSATFTVGTLADNGMRHDRGVVLTRICDPDKAGELFIAMTREGELQNHVPTDARRIGTVDGMTGLPNAVSFHEELDSRTSGGQHTPPFRLVLIDFDCFKQLNSRLGPQVCDALLVQFSDLITQAAGHDCFCARSGGDEFALIVDDAVGAEIPTSVARLIEQCTDHVSGAERVDRFSASAGISRFPADGTTSQELILQAHTALRAAKAAGRGKCLSFDGDMRQCLQRHSSILEVARAAIDGDWMKPYYQPKVDLETGDVVGLEALLRWQSADGVVHLPASISAAFDDPEIAAHISNLMLNKVIADVTMWKHTGSALPVAINASAIDFRDADFAVNLLGRLRAAGLPCSLFELEVTEGVFLGAAAEQVGVALNTLSTAGIRIALDDFGTGYASLTHLKAHPVAIIKIDRSFVSNLVASPDDRAIVSAMIGLSRNLAIEVVAEGIETESQAAILRDLGCHTGQGFLFSQAMPGSEVPDLVRRLRNPGGQSGEPPCVSDP